MVGLIVGVAVALWTASNYVGAFMRASNAIYERDEGRPFWKLRPLQLLVTLVLVLMAALVVLALIVTGPVAEAVGDAVGLGDTAVTAWNIAKWPVMVVVVMLMLAILYWSAPNAKPSGFRWVSPGSVVAVVLWIVASAALRLLRRRTSAPTTRPTARSAGVIVFLVWMWITNIAVLIGAELNAETERARELEAGVPGAEEEIQAPYRDVPEEERERAAHGLTLSFPARRADVEGTCGSPSSSPPGRSSRSSASAMWPDAGAAASGGSEISAETRAATLRFAPERHRSATGRGSWPRSQRARPEAQRLIAEIDGLVEVRTDLPQGEAIGLAEMTLRRTPWSASTCGR